MSLIELQDISLQFTDTPLLDGVSLRVDIKDRLAIVGRNGVGKSTLLKILQGTITPDKGNVQSHAHRIETLTQEIPKHLTGTVYEILQSVHQHHHEWEPTHHIERIISSVDLLPEARVDELSGGQLRRCLLACALVNEPDVLLLDEPTNHMDINTILWLENYLQRSQLTVIMITHDRQFLQNVANRIIEIDRAKLIAWKGDYQGFLQHRATELAAQEREETLFDKRLVEEERWIRQGIKARRTRNEGRVRALKKMRDQRNQRQQKVGQVALTTADVQRSGQQVCLAEQITKSIGEQTIIHDFSCIIQRGDKIGLIGPNGCGKTTLIQCLLGLQPVDSGTVTHGTHLDIAYFDQHRLALNDDQRVMDEVADGQDTITVNGRSQHVISYLQDFLFTPIKARSRVKTLSGGEKNRLLLAKLLLKPANVLVLDEPTNDLDIETLELLEDYLVNYTGTVLLVSHDRAFLNNIITSAYVFGEQGHITEHIGGYNDINPPSSCQSTKTNKTAPHSSQTKKNTTLSYEDRKALQRLPSKIEKLETKLSQLTEQMSEPTFFQQEQSTIDAHQLSIDALEKELETLYKRWEHLMKKDNST